VAIATRSNANFSKRKIKHSGPQRNARASDPLAAQPMINVINEAIERARTGSPGMSRDEIVRRGCLVALQLRG
jgi:hypothetical protein